MKTLNLLLSLNSVFYLVKQEEKPPNDLERKQLSALWLFFFKVCTSPGVNNGKVPQLNFSYQPETQLLIKLCKSRVCLSKCKLQLFCCCWFCFVLLLLLVVVVFFVCLFVLHLLYWGRVFQSNLSIADIVGLFRQIAPGTYTLQMLELLVSCFPYLTLYGFQGFKFQSSFALCATNTLTTEVPSLVKSCLFSFFS